jgi:ribonuclease HI
MSISEEHINIYVDGSCLDNGKPTAIASIGMWIEGKPDMSVSELIPDVRQTNQVAELCALKRAVTAAKLYRNTNVYSDSNYAIKCVTIWYESWKKKGFKTSRKKQPVNIDIVEDIIGIVDEIKSIGGSISFIYVPGHSGNEGNTMAHNLAMTATRSAQC